MRARTYTHFDSRPLKPGFSITIEEHDLPEEEQYHAPGTAYLVKTHKEVIFHSRIHKEKDNRCTFSFSGTFTDEQILRDRDFVSWVLKRYGLVTT